MSYPVLEKIKSVFADSDACVEGANACAKAYCEGTGHPDWYSPFGATDKDFALNMAGPQAVNSAVGVLARMRGFNTPEQVDNAATEILSDIVAGDVTAEERSVLHLLANCSWGAVQPCRAVFEESPDRTTNVFDLLPQDEVDKDWVQIETAANWLLNKLS